MVKDWRIVELERGVWLHRGDGDPSRTLVEENATIFESKAAARRALARARKWRPFTIGENAMINRLRPVAGRVALRSSGRWIRVNLALLVARRLKPEEAPRLRDLVDALACQDHPLKRLGELAAIARQMIAAAKAKCRAHLARHQRERARRQLGAQGAPLWGVMCASPGGG
jgi:hypothetical protein